jgi:hypothetical protein
VALFDFATRLEDDDEDAYADAEVAYAYADADAEADAGAQANAKSETEIFVSRLIYLFVRPLQTEVLFYQSSHTNNQTNVETQA